MQIYLIFDLINVNDNYSPWDQEQIGNKLRTDYIIYQKLANFMYKKDIHVNRLKSDNFGMEMCILQNKTNCKEETEFWRSLNAKIKYTNWQSLKSRWKKGVIFLVIMFTAGVKVINMSKNSSFFVFFCWWQQKH